MPRLRDFDDKSFDPFLADELVYGDIEDPHTPLAELRRRLPVLEANHFEIFGSAYGSQALPGQRGFIVLGYNGSACTRTLPSHLPSSFFAACYFQMGRGGG